ncbi:hypothetical protein [Thomasclavelia cocleata]|uniref:hypothetical protein n=1 Tax=Thomasclavelia cocleata TaxID=69824 RepID=UPI00255AED4A|nr:hypothetical protein [Thomasclavelia cocleata]
MQIQMGVTQKMKLYNVYRLCKKYIDFFDIVEITQRREKDIYGKDISIYKIDNWLELKDIINAISKIPVLASYANEFVQSVPESLRDNVVPSMSEDRYRQFLSKKVILYKKMESIIELYDSMNITETGNGLDIKLPPCEDLKDYISYLKEIDFIFTQCPFLQCENEILKFASVDVGSNWIRLTIAATSTCVLLNQTASVLDKTLALRSHYIAIQQQEEMLKSMQIKNELAEEQIKVFDSVRNATMNNYIRQLENEFGQLDNPEERDKAERSLEKLIFLLDKGCEIYATLDAPEDVQALFPEIQGNLELPDNIINYLEEKTDVQE